MAWLNKHQDVVYTDLGDGAVLVHLDTKYYYSLNEVGLAIWRLLESTTDIDDLVQRLVSDYDVSEDHAKRSACKFIEELKREHLVLQP
ncbi:MAG: PqqD family protein [Acidimicrobiia bacterium]